MMRRGWMKWALIASLAVNVAVGAAVVGAFATGGPARDAGDEARRGGGPPEMRALVRAMPREARRAFFGALRAERQVSDGRAAMRTARAAVIASLRAEPFLAADFAAALQAQRDLQTGLVDAGIAAMTEAVDGLAAADRHAMADALAQRGGGDRR